MKTKPNDAAFSDATDMHGNPTLGSGLTKREYFAVHAPIDRLECTMTIGEADKVFGTRNRISEEQIIAYRAVQYAEALIKELNKD